MLIVSFIGANQNIACDTSVMNNSIPNFPCCKISTEDIQTNAAESVLDLNTIDILMASDGQLKILTYGLQHMIVA